MRPTTAVILILTFLALAAHTVSASFWTVRFTNVKLNYDWYWAEFELWAPNLDYDIWYPNSTYRACAFSIGGAYKADLFSNSGSSGCPGTEMVGTVGNSTTLFRLAVLNSVKTYNCGLLESNSNYSLYSCGDAAPAIVTDTTSTTTSTTSSTTSSTTTSATTTTATSPATITIVSTKTVTVTATPATTTAKATCTSGYSGKKNGKGPNGSCCTNSDDCIDTCVKGVCGVSP